MDKTLGATLVAALSIPVLFAVATVHATPSAGSAPTATHAHASHTHGVGTVDLTRADNSAFKVTPVAYTTTPNTRTHLSR